jgi:hypothetical protein
MSTRHSVKYRVESKKGASEWMAEESFEPNYNIEAAKTWIRQYGCYSKIYRIIEITELIVEHYKMTMEKCEASQL